MDYMKIYQQWCSDPYFDDATKAELKAIENNKEEIEDRFYRQLEFGTLDLFDHLYLITEFVSIF